MSARCLSRNFCTCRYVPFWLVVVSLSAVMLAILTVGCARTEQAATDRPGRLEMAQIYSAQKAGDALLVWKGDRLLVEDYQNGFDPGSRHSLVDGSALFSGFMAVAAVDDGRLTLDEPASETIHQWRSDSAKSTITVSQLLHGTSGLGGTLWEKLTYKEAIEKSLVHDPGHGFRYTAASFQVFAALIKRKIGIPSLKERILRPIGIRGGYWQNVSDSSQKYIIWGYGAQLTAREWGRVGRLILEGGTWEGQEVISDLSPLTEPTAASPGSGLTAWLNTPVDEGHPFYEHLPMHFGTLPLTLIPDGPDGMIYANGPSDLFMSAGGSGQRLYIIPSRSLVVVRFGGADLTWNDAEFLARFLDGRSYSVVDSE